MRKTKEHHHTHKVSGNNSTKVSNHLGWSIALNVGITAAELIGGIISGSIALISDAIHNFSDVISLVVSYIANKLTKRSASDRQTYGFKRSEIVAAFFNSATLMVLACFILYKGIQRLFQPETIDADWVILLAFASILVNGLSVIFIRNDAHKNLNIKSAYLHLFSDLLTSIAVLLGGLAMKYLHWEWIDSAFSIAIALYLLYTTWKIFKNALRIIMQFTPEEIEIPKLVADIKEIPEIENMHHLHIWQINEQDIMLEAHVDLKKDIKISKFETILTRIKEVLAAYKIRHITIQPEFSVSDKKQIIY